MTDTRRNRLFYLVVFPLGHFSVDSPGGALWLLAPAIGIAWGLSPAEIGFIFTAHALGAGLGYLPAGLMGDRYRRRGVLLLITFWWVTAGYIAASMAPSYWVLVALLALAGAGDAAWHPIATGTMVQHMPRQRALALGVHLTGGIMAEVIAPLSAGLLLAFLDWRTVLQIAVVPALGMGVAFLFFNHRVQVSSEPAITKADVKGMIEVWRRPAGLGMFLLVVTYNMAFVALLAMSPLFFQERHGYSPAWAGAVFAIMLLGGGFAAPALGRLSDRAGRKQVTAISSLAAAVAIAVAAFATAPVPLVAGAVIGASLLSGVRPPLLAAGVEIVGRRESTSLGLIYAAMDGVGALGGVLAGLAGSADLRFALLFAATMSAAAAVIALAHPFTTAAGVVDDPVRPTGLPAASRSRE